MNILFPTSPLDPREVEPDFVKQAAAADAEGFPCLLVSFEALVQDGAPLRAARRVPEGSGPCLYRGWMLKPPAYAALTGALEARGAPLVVSSEAYAYAHHLPEVVEVGDGQVSGLRDTDPVEFFRALRIKLDSNL